MERKGEEDKKYLQAFCQRETNPYKYVSHKDGSHVRFLGSFLGKLFRAVFPGTDYLIE